MDLRKTALLTVLLVVAISIRSQADNVATKSSAATADNAIAPTDVIDLLKAPLSETFYTWLKDTKREDPRGVFQLKDGVLHISGDGLGAIVTKNRYRDYHAVIEFKWGEKGWHDREKAARDSGFLIHSNGADGGYGGTWMPSIEVQIIQGGVGDFVPVPGPGTDGKQVPITYSCNVGHDRDGETIWQEDGPREIFKAGNFKRVNWYGRDPDWKDKQGFRGDEDVESTSDKWTRIDVLCDGDHVETFVNGKKVNEAFDVSPSAGHLQLQTELAEINYRRCELYPVGKGPNPAPAE